MKKTRVLSMFLIICLMASLIFPMIENKSYAVTYPDDIQIEGTYNGFGMEISLNGERVGVESKNIVGTAKGYATGEVKNIITIQLAFGDGNIGSVSVNGTNITLPEGTKDRVEFTVEPANKYIIVVTKSQETSNIPRTIIWESDKLNNTSLKDNELLKNGTIEILDIQDKEGKSIGLKDVKQNLTKNNGWASIVPGSKVILRLKPNYGYQLTSIKINDEILVARKEQSTFEYIMPNTNVHICGIFEKVDDKVNAESSKVKNGTIELGEKEINSGSVVLSVNDVELNNEQISNFERNANGYKISSYLDINLSQVIYKGTASSFWENELKDLDNPAKITLNLEEGINGDEVVIAHEKHDGTYEIIPKTYNKDTNTITFATTSFSNYAIASKTNSLEQNSEAVKDDNSNPKTGDNILAYSIIFVISSLGIVTISVANRKNNIVNK